MAYILYMKFTLRIWILNSLPWLGAQYNNMLLLPSVGQSLSCASIQGLAPELTRVCSVSLCMLFRDFFFFFAFATVDSFVLALSC